ncbi:preprotein translocase subunit SecA [Gammaproteobacteria bacterium]|nr:preprotein translocase subunit SecA [Gammaproteobacteria bacterium]MDC3196435.1 preprotein translocase subunit SecA [Gammaproteobacteria bacterium]HAS49085.1 preprotein translocase subunit SecA [Gammaproteobacteria bacterium]
MSIFNKIFGSSNSRKIKKLQKVVDRINGLEPSLEALSDDELKAKTEEFKQRFDSGESMEALLPEAFAVVREAGKRTLQMRHFDVQMIGGIVLHEGSISEMRTGEGKTLMATLPAYLNGLTGKGVHLVTVNEYLAERDANWMRPLYEFLGLSVGIIGSGQSPELKKAAYNCSITYGTNNEFGFDYLRDNMAFRLDDKMQRELNFAIVDEVDSILIDEARTPLIISGAAEDSSKLYTAINQLVPKLEKGIKAEKSKMEMMDKSFVPEESGHFTVDEKNRSVELTESGHEFVEQILISKKLLEEGDSLYSATNLSLLHHIHAALKAHHLFKKDIEYIVQNKHIVLIDEHTGRTMEGRRLSEGLHQALEAKEGLEIQSESQTLASTTFQNYFRLYNNLSGMTGTADTEAFEFSQIYGLDVVVIPTNMPMIRVDANDLIYLSMDEKLEAIVRDITEMSAKGAPVLVGTASIDTSETLSNFLNKENIKHEVLNAKFHEREAQIIAEAGRPGVVTIATNMAGRGTDIVLGGKWESEVAELENPTQEQIAKIKADWQLRHDQVIAAGGLHIVGTERHESRRIDNQLRGRSGRQGDPGYSRFYLSMEDNLLRIFATDGVKNFMRRLGMERGEAIEHGMVTKQIEKAQRKVEGRNFDIRKQLLEYDNVANDQRTIIYRQRNELMASDDISELIKEMRTEVVGQIVDDYIPPQSVPEQWDVEGLQQAIDTEFATHQNIQQWLDEDDQLYEEQLKLKIDEILTADYADKCRAVGDKMRTFEKQITLQILDGLWKDHLATMDHLRQGIFLRSYGGKNPRQEYKREAFALFQDLMTNLQQEVVKVLSHVKIRQEDEVDAIERQREQERARERVNFQHQAVSALPDQASAEAPPAGQGQAEGEKVAPFVREVAKVGRNEPCPCGSGKKYKLCHGKIG